MSLRLTPSSWPRSSDTLCNGKRCGKPCCVRSPSSTRRPRALRSCSCRVRAGQSSTMPVSSRPSNRLVTSLSVRSTSPSSRPCRLRRAKVNCGVSSWPILRLRLACGCRFGSISSQSLRVALRPRRVSSLLSRLSRSMVLSLMVRECTGRLGSWLGSGSLMAGRIRSRWAIRTSRLSQSMLSISR